MSVIDTLITDRTQADVDRYKYLRSLAYDDMTEAEQTEWDGVLKGAYDASDLNRVAGAIAYVAGNLNAAGFELTVTAQSGWGNGDYAQPSTMAAFTSDIEACRMCLTVYATTPQTPADMQRLTYSEANDLEKILKDIQSLIEQMQLDFIYCGEAQCGEF